MSLSEKFDRVTRGEWTTIGIDVQIKLESLTLYVRCSKGWIDWLFNLMAWKKVYSASDVDIVAHSGFTDLWLSIKPYIETLQFDTIIGYSQGSDIGIFIHENFFHRFGFEPETHLFAPAAMLYKPCDKLKSRFSRVRVYYNPFDVVYLIARVLGYEHVGKQIKLPAVSVSRKTSIKDWLLDRSNHTPERYRIATKESDRCGIS